MIVGILLAAGAARRFGSRKLLHPLPDGTPIGLQSARNLAFAVARTIAIVLPGDEALTRLFGSAGIEVCPCPQASEGMGASLACGVRASAQADGWIVALADMPFVQPGTIAAVQRALQEGAALAAPVQGGRRGHPVGIARQYFVELAALTGDVGARDILQRDRTHMVLLPVIDPGVHRDIDVVADLQD